MTNTARQLPVGGATEQVGLGRSVKALNEHREESKQPIKVQIEFRLSAREAMTVAIAGSFNNWNPKKTPLRKSGDIWQTKLELPRGRYEYRFVVDGKWVSDPTAKESAANPFGESNSVFSL